MNKKKTSPIVSVQFSPLYSELLTFLCACNLTHQALWKRMTCKMTHEEELRDTATQLDELLELKSRIHCLDELYTLPLNVCIIIVRRMLVKPWKRGKWIVGYPPYDQHSSGIVRLPLNPRLRERLTNQLKIPIWWLLYSILNSLPIWACPAYWFAWPRCRW